MINQTHLDEPAQLITSPRLKRPPLRFNGWVLSHNNGEQSDHGQLFVTLWRRETGGYTLGFSKFTAHGWLPDAVRVASLEEAFVALEAECGELNSASSDSWEQQPVTPIDTVAFLQKLSAVAEMQARFLRLCGHSMSEWTDLQPHP